MSEIQTFTIKDATITIDSATTLQFNRNKCDQVENPYIFCTAFRAGEYILMFEMLAYKTNKAVEPIIEDTLITVPYFSNPYYMDMFICDELFDFFEIKPYYKNFILRGICQKDKPTSYKKEQLNRFRIYKTDNSSWTEVDFSLAAFYQNGLTNWEYYGNGWMNV